MSENDKRLQRIEMQPIRDAAQSKHSLSDEEMVFISGDSREEIEARCIAWTQARERVIKEPVIEHEDRDARGTIEGDAFKGKPGIIPTYPKPIDPTMLIDPIEQAKYALKDGSNAIDNHSPTLTELQLSGVFDFAKEPQPKTALETEPEKEPEGNKLTIDSMIHGFPKP
ncbi:hypothetical protein KAR91_32755 [Candidatus Pacearchaeota archaeon]|nr:hypothetical protein [Candidatus Pacearchaeota archaeon]